LTFSQNLRHIILPQAWKAAVVPLGSVIIAMIKNSAIAGFFGLVGDLSNRAFSLITTQGQPSIPILITVTAFYLVMTVPLGLVLDRVERRRVTR
jgi:glutamate transport system permease protein